MNRIILYLTTKQISMLWVKMVLKKLSRTERGQLSER